MTNIAELGSKPIFLLNPPGAPDGARRSLVLAPAPDRTAPRVESQFSPEEIETLRGKWGQNAIIDPTEVLCDGDQCSVAENGVEYYTDGNHLSVNGAALLTPKFIAGIQDALVPTGN